jgi:hypothetical protein
MKSTEMDEVYRRYDRQQQRKNRDANWKKVLLVILGLPMLCMLMVGLTNVSNQPASRGGSSFNPHAFSPNGVLRQTIAGAVSEEVFDRLSTLKVAGDRQGIESLFAVGLVVPLESGTRYRVIDPGILVSEVKIESGPYVGNYLFVAAEQAR